MVNVCTNVIKNRKIHYDITTVANEHEIRDTGKIDGKSFLAKATYGEKVRERERKIIHLTK